MHSESILKPAEGGLISWIRSLLGGPRLRLQWAGAGASTVAVREEPITTPERPDAFHNSGGPRSRTRRETLNSSLFPPTNTDPEYSFLGARRIGRVWAVCRGGESLRDVVLKMIAEWGFVNADDAFELLDGIPLARLHCRPAGDDLVEEGPRPRQDPLNFLRNALVLSKCSGRLYDPRRPVILTEKRLSQRLELFEIDETFYEEES